MLNIIFVRISQKSENENILKNTLFSIGYLVYLGKDQNSNMH
jgi:hypothetical protein